MIDLGHDCDSPQERRKSLTCSTAASTPRQRTRGLSVLPTSFLVLAARFSNLTVGDPDEPCSPASPGKEEAPHVSCLLMLLACRYDEADVVTTVAIAAANVLRQAKEFKQMGDRERAFLASIHLYLAHVFVFDECVPLRCWHEWAFANYCTFGCLNRTVGKLLRLMHYRPSVATEIVLHNVAYFNGQEDEALAAPLKGKW